MKLAQAAAKYTENTETGGEAYTSEGTVSGHNKAYQSIKYF